MPVRNSLTAAVLLPTASVPAFAQKFPRQTGHEYGSACLVLAMDRSRACSRCIQGGSAGVNDCSYRDRNQRAVTATGARRMCAQLSRAICGKFVELPLTVSGREASKVLRLAR